ncbi:MAG TPA: hypothetical protein VFF12_09765 [Myxococcaceae bacterium]|nr:hypothetical protein [Myxococcaceae bacterium]
MIFADILFWFLMVAGAYLALNAYWLAAVALFRPAVERARLTYATRPVAATLAGLLGLVPVALVFAVFARAAHPGVKLLTGALLMVPLILALVGSAGLADKIGAGLASPVDEAQPWRRVLRGGAVLGLLFVVPLLGWFAVFPLTLASGLGALFLPRRAGPIPEVDPRPRLGKPPLQIES